MRYYHRHSLFPIAVILLSLGLAGFMYQTLQNEPSSSTIQMEEVVPVDADAYQSDLSKILAIFEERFFAATDDLDKLIATETALAGVLSLRVPTQYKDLHIGLAVAFNQLQSGLKAEDRDTQGPIQSIETLKTEYSWLGK